MHGNTVLFGRPPDPGIPRFMWRPVCIAALQGFSYHLVRDFRNDARWLPTNIARRASQSEFGPITYPVCTAEAGEEPTNASPGDRSRGPILRWEGIAGGTLTETAQVAHGKGE